MRSHFPLTVRPWWVFGGKGGIQQQEQARGRLTAFSTRLRLHAEPILQSGEYQPVRQQAGGRNCVNWYVVFF